MESVAISTKAAATLGELDLVDGAKLSSLCKCFLQSVITGTSKIAIEDSDVPMLRAISTLLLESAKSKVEPSVVTLILKENGSTINANILVDLYTQHQSTLSNHMETTGIAAPSIIGLDWRLDYSVRSKHGGRENIPMFFVTLHVNDRSVIRDIDMIATQDEMKDLLSRVKEAVRSVDKVVNAVQNSDNDDD